MEAKEYLNQIRRYTAMMRTKESEIKQLTDALYSIGSAANMRDDKVMGGRKEVDKIGDMVARLQDLMREKNDTWDDLIDKREEIISVIEKIDDTDVYEIIHMRYVQLMEWEVIAEKKHMSVRWVFELHGQGLSVIDKFLKCAVNFIDVQ